MISELQFSGKVHRAAVHYDRVVDAWRHYLMGEDLHFGYFEQVDAPLSEATRALTQLMAQEGGIARGMCVLDVGCGIGNPAIYLARTYGCKVLGISPSEGCIDRAQARAAHEGMEELVAFSVRDGMSNGLSNGTFDRVWIMESSHLMPHKDQLLAESARVLRDGGKVVLCDVILRREITNSELLSISTELRTIDAVYGQAKTEPLSAYVEMAQAAGLRVERELDISDKVKPTFARWRQNAEIYGEEVAKIIGEKALSQFKNSCDAFARLWRDNVLGYGLLVATRRSLISASRN